MTAKRYISMLLVMLVSMTGAYAQMSFIKDVKVRVGAKGNYSDLTSEGYTVISGPDETYFDFNGGGTGGDYVYIGYKTTTNPNEAISDLAVVYNNSGTSTAYGSDDFLYGGSKTMMIGSKRYYLAPHIGGPDMNNRNNKHNNCVYLYYTRDVDASDGMRLLTTLGGNRWGDRHTTVPSGWDSMIRGYMGNGQPKTTGGSTYEVTYDAERVFGDTNEAGGGDYTYILCNYVSGIYYVDIDRKAKLPNAVTELTNTSSTLNAGWYIVRGQNVQTGTLTCNGAVNIILADGAKLTATGQANNPGIQVSAAGSSLAIYGQTAQSGQLTAIGGTGASAIDGGSSGATSPININTSLVVYADGNNPPTTFIDYTIGEDVSALLSGKRYVTMRIPKNITVTLDRQGGTGETQVTAKEGSAMPTITVPTRTGYTFHGYYASKNGTGTKYYNADGTSAHKWDRTGTATLYAHWTPNQYTVTFDMQNGIGGTESATATYDDAMPEITIPTREDYAFTGYFSQPNGRGTKYYNADGTSAQAWNITSNTTLYAQWEVVRAWYIDADGSSKSVTDFTTITDKSETTTLSSGWYIVNDANVQTRTLVCEGAVHIILLDGAKLTATGDYLDAGIRVSAEGASLTIYGQQNQTGQLIATANDYPSAGIGGRSGGSGHDITINGGIITATGGDRGAGIGGGMNGSGYNITINGGIITASAGVQEGKFYASAIGGGRLGGSSNITVNSSLALYADDNNPPATLIDYTIGEDVSAKLSGKQYAIVRKPIQDITVTFDKQGGIGGTDQVIVDEGSAMPTITIPTRERFAFVGYFSSVNGTGTKYYNADGTSSHLWNYNENTTLYAYWSGAVPYIDADGIEKYTGIDGEISSSTTILTSGWYLVKESNVQTGTLVCEGAVNIILADGAKLTATGGDCDAGIRVSAEGTSLTIYGQKNQTGQLIATGGDFGSGIGGAVEGSGHDITINGGVITANGGILGAGIGGGSDGAGHDITINGGVIKVVGGTGASAIGAGVRSSSSNIHINAALFLKADNNATPSTVINHTSKQDVANLLNGKQYAVIEPNPNPTSVWITVNRAEGMDAPYGTFYSSEASYQTATDDATIYTASVGTINGETCLILHELEGDIIPIATPVILKSEGAKNKLQLDIYTNSISGITVPDNSLSGTDTPMSAPANCYIMSYGQNGFGFYKYAVGKALTAHKAYLIESAIASPTSMTMDFTGNATGNYETDKVNTGSSNPSQE